MSPSWIVHRALPYWLSFSLTQPLNAFGQKVCSAAVLIHCEHSIQSAWQRGVRVQKHPCLFPRIFEPVRSLSLQHSFSQMHFADSPVHASCRHTRSRCPCNLPWIWDLFDAHSVEPWGMWPSNWTIVLLSSYSGCCSYLTLVQCQDWSHRSSSIEFLSAEDNGTMNLNLGC